MVAVGENLTEVEGVIASREPHPRRPGFDDVVCHVERAAPVEGKADLGAGPHRATTSTSQSAAT